MYGAALLFYVIMQNVEKNVCMYLCLYVGHSFSDERKRYSNFRDWG